MKRRIKDLAFTLKIPKKSLIDISEAVDAEEKIFYRNWSEPKTDKNGQNRIENGILLTRTINAPVYRLKQIQSQLLRQVLYKLNLPDYFYGGVKDKDAVLNGRHHQGNKHFLLTDLKDFYPSLSYKRVESALRKEGFYPDVSRLITRLCTKDGAIPQGCPTSSFLASLVVFHSAGDLFESYINDGFKVSIYVDDITISSPIDFKSMVPRIIEDLRGRDLKINFDKTFYCTANPIVTGVFVKNNGISALAHTYEKSNDTTISEASRSGHQQRIEYIKKVSKKKNPSKNRLKINTKTISESRKYFD
jgi:RNA-directed DNA polymerase